MTKYEFLAALEQRLSALSAEDRKRSLDFYAEMIDDRVDEGMSETDAVASLGSLDSIVSEIPGAGDGTAPLPQKAPKEKKGLRSWMWALILLGSPLWLSLLAGAIVLVIGLLGGVFGAVIGVTVGGFGLLVGGLGLLVMGILVGVSVSWSGGLFLLGSGFVCGGLGLAWAVFFFWLAKLLWRLLKFGWSRLRSLWKKEDGAV